MAHTAHGGGVTIPGVNVDADLPALATRLWAAAGMNARAAGGAEGRLSLAPLGGGANNRVYRVAREGQGVPEGQGVLKVYFRHPGDLRDRLKAEYGFLNYAWQRGIRCVPQPLAQDAEAGAALYSYIQGRPLNPIEVDAGAVQQAMDFWAQLNKGRDTAEAQALGAASEACFSLAEHLACVQGRISRLAALPAERAEERDASDFVRRELAPAWRDVAERAIEEAGRLGWAMQEELPAEQRRISPSDFGFHNALLRTGGTEPSLVFLDFEYAGWDDPVKAVCDFFCQVRLPVAGAYLPAFADAVLAREDWARERARVAVLLPVYRVKWCCILLNDFLPGAGGRARRNFAGASHDEQERLRGQLEKAKVMLAAARTAATDEIEKGKRGGKGESTR
ncbi:MAG: aminoglycoside phosphotransferase family protein [Phycisphaeraceae bacterium]|nr:aminoglycoside phosphotransferase family protein [Phycisphaeraceae bacterium]